MKPTLFFLIVVFSAVLSACSTAPPEDEFIGTWKADLEGVDSAIVEIRKDGEQIIVKLKGLRNSQELEFPATYNKEAKHLEFRFGGFIGDKPATAYLNNDTLSINSDGATLDFERLLN